MSDATSITAEAEEPKLFKFLNHEDAHYLLGNQISLKFGRLRYYRLLEACTLDNRIGDLREGLAVTEAKSRVVIREGENEDLREALDVAGIVRATAGTIEIGQMQIRSSIDCFVLSLGAGCFDDLCKEFTQNGPNSYDAAVELRSLGRLIDAIHGSKFDGRPIDESFNIRHGLVHYCNNEPADFHVVRRVESGNPFIKDKTLYENQSEFRIVLYPKIAIPDLDDVFLSLQGDADFFAQVDVDGSTRVPCDLAHKIVDFEEVLTRCFQRWSQRERVYVDLTRDGWQVLAEERRQAENIAFQEIRREMIDAYWCNRRDNKSAMVDEAIVDDMEHQFFNSRFALFARSIGLNVIPPF